MTADFCFHVFDISVALQLTLFLKYAQRCQHVFPRLNAKQPGKGGKVLHGRVAPEG